MIEQVNTIAEMWWNWMWPMFWQVSVLIGFIALIDFLIRKHVWPQVRYALWLLVIVKLLLPPSFALRTSVVSRIQPLVERSVRQMAALDGPVSYLLIDENMNPDERSMVRLAQPPAPVEATVGAEAVESPVQVDTSISAAGSVRMSFSWHAIAMIGWTVTALLLMLRLLSRHRALWRVHCERTCDRDLPQWLPPLVDGTAKKLRLRRAPQVVLSSTVNCPAVLGVFRPVLLLPEATIERLSRQETEHILLHELAHIKRRDLPVHALCVLLQIFYWFNPLLNLVRRQLQHLRELCCDATVAGILRDRAEDYSQTILRTVEWLLDKPRWCGIGLLGLIEDPGRLRVRLAWLRKKPSQHPRLRMATALLVGGLMFALLLPMARAEESNKDATVTPQVISTEATEKAPPASESDTIVDSKTGLKFTVAKKISGENDVIVGKYGQSLSRSPDGRFLLYQGQVVPLDGSRVFKLEALHGVADAAWSPDGKLIAYLDKRAIWLLPVSPETGQPTGPARKLLDDQLEPRSRQILWSRDSEWIMLYSYSCSDYRHAAVSVQDGRLMQPLDYTRFSLRSPDQKSLAYFKPHNGVWTMPVQGGASRLAVGSHSSRNVESAVVPLWWSPDADWLLFGTGKRTSGTYDDLRFVRLADHRDVELRWFPQQVGREVLGVTPDGKKLQFYKTSYEIRRATKVASIRGGRLAELAFSRLVGFNGARISSPDGRRWFFMVRKPDIGDKQDTYAYAPYVAASAAADPVEVKLPEEVKRQHAFNYWSADRWLLSPDGKRLVRQDEYVTSRGESVVDLYSIPISLEKAQSTGPATLIAQAWPLDYYDYEIAWSPDSSRLAIYGGPKDQAGLWVVPADGSPPKQLTQSPKEYEESPRWSPDGKFIAYRVESAGQVSLYTVSAEGGASKRLWTKSGINSLRYTWFPDSKEIGLASDGAIVAVDIADGSVRPFLNLAEGGFTQLQWFQWSPDGRTLGLYGNNDGKDGKVALFHVADKKIEMLPPDPDPGEEPRFDWTGDSQSIFCTTWQYEKVRPAALIYEVDLVEAWTQAKNSVAGVSSPASASAVAKLEAPPLVNGEFRDDFEDGDTRYWTFDEPSIYDHVREVQNGELVLENTRAFIGLPEWTNYVVTVRLRIKEATGVVPWSGGFAGVGFRRAEHGEYCLSLDRDQKALWFGVCYWDVDYVTGMLAEPAFNYVMDKWYTIQVEVKGPHIVVRVDGQSIMDLNDENCPQGPVALIASLHTRVHFDDFSVRLLQ